VDAAMNLRVPKNGGYFSTSVGTVSFSRRALLRGVGEVAYVVSCSRRPDPFS
jgi:hypothetical protein